ncbi:EF-hand domain-containing protein [Stenotrophomonas sp. SMYL11]|uniref:EF-hand domain-containing protein n=1 Tax=Stenotrophomonas sp. SMYL11 TaxID=3076042 RepID=UPI002E7A370D|nr:EF-hand domain-containing protein [Stenotrophomonas sp. SMYL11]
MPLPKGIVVLDTEGEMATQPLPASVQAGQQPRQLAVMDSNGNGRIGKSESAKYQQARFSSQADSIDAAFKEMDADKDGKISRKDAGWCRKSRSISRGWLPMAMAICR